MDRPSKISMLHQVELNSLDVSNLLWDMQKTCVTNEDIEVLWEIKNVWLVRNKDLEERYERKRKLMKNLKRSEEQIQDDLLFMAEGWNNVHKICKYGPRCQEKKNNVLGDTQYGIHMNRHYDILTRFMAFKNFQQANYIVVLRAMLGRIKKVKPFLTGEYGCIAPTPNYDSHIAEDEPDLTSIDICDAIAYNFVYMYEYDEETILPMAYPSHVLPIAVIQLYRTRNRLVRPLKYTRERDLVNSKNVQRLTNETKPLKHLPKAAPYKKYVVEGRRSGTKLISDVPIEPPSKNPPSETTKRLEKFRRASTMSGGTGMAHLFYKLPFNKMPLSWQRKFSFKKRPKYRLYSKGTYRKRSRSRSSSKESDKSRELQSRSPTPPKSLSREKNLFEIFDKSNEHVSSQLKEQNITSVNSDKGSNKTGSRPISGNNTPTQDELYCNDVNVFPKIEVCTDSASDTTDKLETPKICLEHKNSNRGPEDNNWMRSNEFTSCFTPESTTSMNESQQKDTMKGISSSTKCKKSSTLQNASKETSYQLIRITTDEPDTQSIYHELRGIKLPICDKKAVKDPRLLRAMGCIIESPVMAGFGPFLRRIKEEPPDDHSYEKDSVKKMKNILPIQSIKKEPELEQNEDDVEKVLKELDNAIKAIQNEKDPESTKPTEDKKNNNLENCKNSTTGDTEVKKQNTPENDKELEKDEFHPRNMGFSSYLPEYSDSSDFERTARVLTEVFSDKASSPTKKLPMSMSDYFGTSNPNVSLSSTKTNIEHKLSDINSDCETTRAVEITKRNQENDSDNTCKSKVSTEVKSETDCLESRTERKHAKNEASSASRMVHLNESENDNSSSDCKLETNTDRELSKERSRSRSLHSSHKTRSRSRSVSNSKTHKRKLKRKRSRSNSLSKIERGRVKTKSSHSKKKKQKKHKSRRSPSCEKKRSRSKSLSIVSGEWKEPISLSSRSRSRSSSSKRSLTGKKHDLSNSNAKDGDENKTDWKSRAEVIRARENSPGRLLYLEQRRKLDISKRLIAKAKRQKEEGIAKRCDNGIDVMDIHYQKVLKKSRHLSKTFDSLDDHRSSFVEDSREAEFSERRGTTTSDESVVNSTLSKAMTSLLKKIVFRDNCNQDNSAEGRMADMVIELVKDQMSKELQSSIVSTAGSSTSTMQNQSVHPFVPYLKQTRGMEELYGANPWNASTNIDRRSTLSGFPDKYMEHTYQSKEADDNRSLTSYFHSKRRPYTSRNRFNFSHQEHLGDSNRSSFRGKLYHKVMEKTRGSTYRGRLNSSRGFHHQKAWRGSYKSRGRGNSSYSSSSNFRGCKDKDSNEKR
ncbi:uncharacterized protein LOC133199509 isoform X1 [Saccostrea echinata]|uniref:uncharacterized protein LOC133199509 isoform X1 n=1 Tax=Saccostrea echinata TaxID=191078 RepID=UPI002A7F175A|nr:uncharacterized protein LOC133199509 isoform X1 [Saccostrea echinata]